MPKKKTFDISRFVDESAEGVKVAEQQIQNERETRARENAVPVQQTVVTQPIAEQPAVQYVAAPAQAVAQAPQYVAQPMQVPVQTTQIPVVQVTPIQQPSENPAKGKRGRKKSLRTIERINGKIVFLEKETDADLSRISTLERFDKQDIIRTALYQWLQKHYDGNMLDNEGRGEIIQYIARTTTFEDL